MASLKPFSTDGINSLGILPPLILFTKLIPAFQGQPGPIVQTISANLPLPPDCFL